MDIPPKKPTPPEVRYVYENFTGTKWEYDLYNRMSNYLKRMWRKLL